MNGVALYGATCAYVVVGRVGRVGKRFILFLFLFLFFFFSNVYLTYAVFLIAYMHTSLFACVCVSVLPTPFKVKHMSNY